MIRIPRKTIDPFGVLSIPTVNTEWDAAHNLFYESIEGTETYMEKQRHITFDPELITEVLEDYLSRRLKPQAISIDVKERNWWFAVQCTIQFKNGHWFRARDTILKP